MVQAHCNTAENRLSGKEAQEIRESESLEINVFRRESEVDYYQYYYIFLYVASGCNPDRLLV